MSAGLGAGCIEIADTVRHGPTSEDWIVARVTDQHVYPAGWPPCRAELSHCTLLGKATEKQRAEMLASKSRSIMLNLFVLAGPTSRGAI